jgi:hypothetical protein
VQSRRLDHKDMTGQNIEEKRIHKDSHGQAVIDTGVKICTTSLMLMPRKSVLVQTCRRCVLESYVKGDVEHDIIKMLPALPIDFRLEEGGQSKY